VSEPIIRLENISRVFQDPAPTYSLRGVNLDVAEGEFLAIMGSSGAGKSTLLNLIGLLDVPTSGRLLVAGRDAGSLAPRELDELRSLTIGFVFQDAHLMPYETTARNVALGLSLIGIPWHQRRDRVRQALMTVDLMPRAGHLARSLSGGERQRAAVARAIATGPRLILADEPTGNLDSKNSQNLLKLLQGLNRGGVTVVMVTHDLEAAQYADRTVWMADGRIVRSERGPNAAPTALPGLQASAEAGRARVSRLASFMERAADALSNLTTRPGRAAALVAAFLLGTGTLVAAAGLGESASTQIAERISQSGLDEVQVALPSGQSLEDRQLRASMVSELSYVLEVGLKVPVDASLAQAARFPSASDRDIRFSGSVIGADEGFLAVAEVQIEPGLSATLFDDPNAGHVAIVGQAAADELSLEPRSSASEVWIGDRPYTVIGVITDAGRDPTLESAIIIPAAALPDLASTLVVRTEVGYPAPVAEAIPLQLEPSSPGSVDVSTVADLRSLRVGVAGDLGGLVASAAVVLLVMATLSAGTALYLSIQSRVQELALRRALGARRLDLAAMFVIEGALVGVAGGMAGVAMGTLACAITCLILGWTAVVPPVAVAIGLASGLLGGVLSSIIPAVKAAQISPAEAIR
jgi:macrolide transport system ATP-binding/permease protein